MTTDKNYDVAAEALTPFGVDLHALQKALTDFFEQTADPELHDQVLTALVGTLATSSKGVSDGDFRMILDEAHLSRAGWREDEHGDWTPPGRPDNPWDLADALAEQRRRELWGAPESARQPAFLKES